MKTVSVIDQMRNKVEVPLAPQHIISLVPSQTELLFDLGLGNRIAGVTRFCIHPGQAVKKVMKVGGTKHFDFEKIKQLQPDLVIGNKEENYEEGINELRKYFPVWMSDIYCLEDALVMIKEVGKLTGKHEEAELIAAEISLPCKREVRLGTGAYFIWRKPYMVAAGNTFIQDMLSRLGVVNAFAGRERYPEITPEELSVMKPDFIFLSSEPYSFREQHIAEFEAFCPNAKIMLVDGEMFSWYGSRLRLVPAYFEKLRREMLQ